MAQVYTYIYRFFSESHLSHLCEVDKVDSWTRRLVRRYCRWDTLYRRLAASERYSYARLEGLREGVQILYMQVLDVFYSEYQPTRFSIVRLPCNRERWELERAGERAVIRAERWCELVADNVRCKENLLQQEGYEHSQFCPVCSHFLTREEQDRRECACCGEYFDFDFEEDEEDWENDF